MGVFKKAMALMLSLVMIASMSTTQVFAEGETATTPGISAEPTAAPTEPTAAPTEPTATPTEPTAAPTEPTATPTEPTATPTEPTAAPTEPTATPTEPTATPTEPTAEPPKGIDPNAAMTRVGGQLNEKFIIAKFVRGTNAPEESQTLSFDATSKDRDELAVYKILSDENGLMVKANAIDLDLSKFSITNQATDSFWLKKSNVAPDGTFNAAEVYGMVESGAVNVTYTDGGISASVNVAITGIPNPIATTGYAFIKQYDKLAVGISTLECDYNNLDINEQGCPQFIVSIYDYAKREAVFYDWNYIKIADEAVLDYNSRGQQIQGKNNAILMIPKKTGDSTTTFKYKDTTNSIDLSMTVNIKNAKIADVDRTEIIGINSDGAWGAFLGVETGYEGQVNTAIIPFAFVRTQKKENESAVITDLKFKDGDFEVITKQIKGTPIASLTPPLKIDDIIRYVKTPDGKHGYQRMAKADGEFLMILRYTSPIAAENNKDGKCERAIRFIVTPQEEHAVIRVDPDGGADADFTTIQGAIDAVSTIDSTNTKITEIQLAAGKTFTGNVDVNKRVFITGDKTNPPIIKGTVNFSADKLNGNNLAEAYMVDTIIEGTGKTGNGVTFTDKKYGQINNVTIRNFDVGIVATDSSRILSAKSVENCNIGMTVDRKVNSGGGISYPLQFKGNDVAVKIIAMPQRYFVQSTGINFINNGTNVVNETANEIRFAFSHFAHNDSGFVYDTNLRDKFTSTNTGTVTFSPYYQTPIGINESGKIYPEKAFIDPSAFSGLGIAKDEADKPIDTTNFKTDAGITLNLQTIDNDTGATTSVAGWSFTAPDNTKAPTFNPAIATKLADSSTTATDKIPGGIQYQPVSFAHHGALPGTAEVKVKKTAPLSAAAGDKLKLFKIVGNGLVLQPEEATLNANGELVFNRDSASDYVISGTDISTPDTTGNTGSGDDDSGGSNDYTGADEVTSKLDSVPVGGSVSFDVSIKSNVSASVFAELAQSPGKTLVLRGDGYSWNIKGSDMLSPIAGLLAVNTTISGVSPNAKAIKAITGDAVIQNLYFGYHGNLPFTATINVEVAANLRGKPLNLYHIDGNLKNLMLMESGLVAKDGRVSFPVSSCSDYILTADTIPGATIGKKAMHNVTNPDTGAKDTAPLAAGIALMSVLGMAVLLKDDRKKK